MWVALPYAAVSRNRETIISLQRLNGPHNEKHDQQKLDVGKPEPEMESDDKSAPVSPVPESDWENVLTRDTTVDGQVLLHIMMFLDMCLVTLVQHKSKVLFYAIAR